MINHIETRDITSRGYRIVYSWQFFERAIQTVLKAN